MCIYVIYISLCIFLAELCALFCDQLTTAWGRSKALPLKKLQEKGFLENKKLIVKVEVKVIEVVDEAEEVTRKEMLDVQGFKVLHSQVCDRLDRVYVRKKAEKEAVGV